MKVFRDLTREEKLALTPEQLQQLLDLNLAENGLRRVPAPQAPTKPPLKTRTLFGVTDPYSTPSIAFETPEAASKFLELKPIRISRDWRSGFDVQGDSSRQAIQPIEILDGSTDSVQAALNGYNRMKEEYDALKKKFDQEEKEIDALDQEILDELSVLRNEERARDRVRQDYAEFLGLAEGEHTIAMRFLSKRYTPTQIEEAQVAKEEVPQ
jgi:hypothetical protein